MKTYEQTVDWLMEKLPMFQRVGTKAYKKNLNNILALTEYLGNPQESYPTIHVAGTNGKGSTCHMLASILQESGYKTGLTTSPHLKDFRERIRINGEICSEDFVIEFVGKNAAKIEGMKTSFFEVSIAMAFDYFRQEKVDIAVIETGLGGRLDSTNILTPIVSTITNIGLDHTHILGDTIEKIAWEKAGIIKENVPIVIGEAKNGLRNFFSEIANERNAPIFFAEDFDYPFYNSDLKGIYQRKNQKTVLKTINIIQENGYRIQPHNIEDGMANVTKNTGLRGRWDVLNKSPLIIADTAHNVDGIKEILCQISDMRFDHLHFVLGFVNDKDVSSILKLFPKNATYYFTEPSIARKMNVDDLRAFVPDDFQSQYFDSVELALNAARKNAKEGDLVYIGGSTFVVAEVI